MGFPAGYRPVMGRHDRAFLAWPPRTTSPASPSPLTSRVAAICRSLAPLERGRGMPCDRFRSAAKSIGAGVGIGGQARGIAATAGVWRRHAGRSMRPEGPNFALGKDLERGLGSARDGPLAERTLGICDRDRWLQESKMASGSSGRNPAWQPSTSNCVAGTVPRGEEAPGDRTARLGNRGKHRNGV
jgi:hypothetical protein